MATWRVDMGTAARRCVREASKRWRAAAAMAAPISPATLAALSVSNACRLAYACQAFNRHATCQRPWSARESLSRGERCAGRGVTKEQHAWVRRCPLRRRRRRSVSASPCQGTTRATR
jgi:hypothetical protein